MAKAQKKGCHLTLYIRAGDRELIEQCRLHLLGKGSSLSQFMVECLNIVFSPGQSRKLAELKESVCQKQKQ